MLLCQFHLTAKAEKHRAKTREVNPSICYDQSWTVSVTVGIYYFIPQSCRVFFYATLTALKSGLPSLRFQTQQLYFLPLLNCHSQEKPAPTVLQNLNSTVSCKWRLHSSKKHCQKTSFRAIILLLSVGMLDGDHTNFLDCISTINFG